MDNQVDGTAAQPEAIPTTPMPVPLTGANVVVTGGAGFLGSWLCERLVTAGAYVQCFDTLVTGRLENIGHLLDHERFRFVDADVCAGIAAQRPVDYVLHLASPASPVHYARLPIETLLVGSVGTRNALDLAHQDGARFLLASTSEVYGDPEEHPQPETYPGRVDPVGPRSVYDEAKRFAEALTTAYRTHLGTNTAIARIFNTYGPRMARDDGRVVPTFITQALAGQPLTVAGSGSQTRSLCWVGDLVEGLVRLATSHHAGPVNLGSEDEWTVRDLAVLVRQITSSSSPIQHVDLPQDDPTQRRPELSRARELLGWEPTTPLEEGLERTVRWFAEAGREASSTAARWEAAPAGG